MYFYPKRNKINLASLLHEGIMIKLLKNGKQIDYATLPYVPLSFQFDDTQQVKDKFVLCDKNAKFINAKFLIKKSLEKYQI